LTTKVVLKNYNWSLNW